SGQRRGSVPVVSHCQLDGDVWLCSLLRGPDVRTPPLRTPPAQQTSSRRNLAGETSHYTQNRLCSSKRAIACYQQLTAFDEQWCDSVCEHAKGVAIANEPTEAVLHETYP